MNILRKRRDLPFSRKSDRKKEKSKAFFTHEQNIICSQTLLDGIVYEQTIICRQLFAGHVVGSRPMKRKKNLLRMMIRFHFHKSWYSQHVKHSLILSLRIEKVAKMCVKTQHRGDKEKKDYKLQISEYHHSL